MTWADVSQSRRFSADRFQKVNLFETDRMFCDTYCFEPGQEQAAHKHQGADKIYYVLEGEGFFTVGDHQRVAKQGMLIVAPGGVPHGVTNNGRERLSLLVTISPPIK